ncbi:serine hydrolase domain-containing protein [Pseudodonghicola xiamenensis]|uniref:Beta-lactamase-related domain-containing protein n=1 Tax=Pseudodonghicola xiamenensis TaxID=337702 RepID=A0A8J3H8S8_9RHOB|nr:serine hydrolase [Pseudodonghicola xiamenensis]GHG92128.1 hypothetical protein GCM10010961_23850 [Pseudodonghicola xiamenensis]
MRSPLIWLGRLLLAFVLAALVVGFWKRDDLMRLWTVKTLFDESRIVQNFSHMERGFHTVPVSRGSGPVVTLDKGQQMTLPEGTESWIDDRRLTSLLVLQDGQIRHEGYYQGTEPEDRRISWSLAKSYLSVLLGALIAEGTIGSLDDPVVKYVPSLIGSAYDGTSIRNVLNMTSGVAFDEDYFDPDSDINRMGRVVALGGSLDAFTASFTRRIADPGANWRYVSIDTHAIGMVIRGATGRTIPDLLSEKIIAPLGLEQDGLYLTDGTGTAFVLGGLNFTTRDYARFGRMILQGGAYDGHQIVPADWIVASILPSAPTAHGKLGYGYQWWVPKGAHDGEFMAIGIYGQYLYFDQPRGVMIVVTAADPDFETPGTIDDNVEVFRKIARSL